MRRMEEMPHDHVDRIAGSSIAVTGFGAAMSAGANGGDDHDGGRAKREDGVATKARPKAKRTALP